MESKRIHSALISVYNKEGLEQIVRKLNELDIVIYSTGGTKDFIEDLDVPVISVETITDYPAILGGRVKTLHPKIFGGILAIRNEDHLSQLAHFRIPLIDLVVVDLYPFEETLKQTEVHEEIIEKIDIGGISLIRAAAKNFQDVVVVPSMSDYNQLLDILANNAISSIEERKSLASRAFEVSQHYDSCIHDYLRGSLTKRKAELRYGENPHQHARFLGNLNECLQVLSGKELSYNNILDVDAALNLMSDFRRGDPCFAVFKHTNACGLAVRKNLKDAWNAALAGDPVSAFGGILICNRKLDLETATEINPLFYEVLLAPDFGEDALKLLTAKKNRILIRILQWPEQLTSIRTAINGILEQDSNKHHASATDLKWVTLREADALQTEDLLFAIHCVKHLKSNAIALVKNKQLIGMGCGQTSRVDACKQAIDKARKMGFDPKDACLASEAFFPFPDCVEIAGEAGISSISQPGGSVNDNQSITKADELGIAMAFTGIRHFKH
ncbi:MAG: bifunctional phosphoribosylaminoimidazolecarboxamide formyltransferase/IMP cyclohydrolase [Saprospiraceae bacterium]|nr:bifunctional phosphoribosylaminoimidazolecarboxamide formyltransferase/IMP cyclohydrolase [Saprospiraceae bacterium]